MGNCSIQTQLSTRTSLHTCHLTCVESVIFTLIVWYRTKKITLVPVPSSKYADSSDFLLTSANVLTLRPMSTRLQPLPEINFSPFLCACVKDKWAPWTLRSSTEHASILTNAYGGTLGKKIKAFQSFLYHLLLYIHQGASLCWVKACVMLCDNLFILPGSEVISQLKNSALHLLTHSHSSVLLLLHCSICYY